MNIKQTDYEICLLRLDSNIDVRTARLETRIADSRSAQTNWKIAAIIAAVALMLAVLKL